MAVVTLCGSTKFKDAYQDWNRKLTLKGHLVFTVTWFGHAEKAPPTDHEKEILDGVHKGKIDRSDAILVLNVDDYIGESTKSEVEHARANGKKVYWMQSSQHALSDELVGVELLV